MREYKFRGQRQSDNKWIYGDLLQPTEMCDIYEISDCESIDGSRYDVIRDTVGQYTGLKDKNGKEIYEGDIVAEKGHYVNSDKLVYQKIQWKENYSCWLRGEYQRLTPKNIKTYEIEVVGNIWEDSDLLDDTGNTEANKI